MEALRADLAAARQAIRDADAGMQATDEQLAAEAEVISAAEADIAWADAELATLAIQNVDLEANQRILDAEAAAAQAEVDRLSAELSWIREQIAGLEALNHELDLLKEQGHAGSRKGVLAAVLKVFGGEETVNVLLRATLTLAEPRFLATNLLDDLWADAPVQATVRSTWRTFAERTRRKGLEVAWATQTVVIRASRQAEEKS